MDSTYAFAKIKENKQTNKQKNRKWRGTEGGRARQGKYGYLDNKRLFPQVSSLLSCTLKMDKN